MSDTQMLIKLQECDMEAMRARKELDELPEAAQIMECRARRKEIKAKQDQVVELSDEVEDKLAKLQAEEARVIEKINDLQQQIDTSSDYRVTQHATRDMEGQLKRQKGIAEEQNDLLERQIKIDGIADQVAGMLADVDHREAHLTAAFKEKGGAIKVRIDSLAAERAELLAKIEGGLARRYEKLREEKAGIGVTRLEGDHCSVCRWTFLEGQLSKLLKGPALSECPNCHRLIIVREEDE